MNNNTVFNWNYDILNSIALVSFMIALQNLDLNLQQTKGLDEHLKTQDGILNDQNETYLKKIIEQNEEIIELLKGGKNENKRND